MLTLADLRRKNGKSAIWQILLAERTSSYFIEFHCTMLLGECTKLRGDWYESCDVERCALFVGHGWLFEDGTADTPA